MIEEIARYWDKQSAIWRDEKQEAWMMPETKYWSDYFADLKKSLSGIRALEVGTASGYFANILTLAGFEVDAVDISPNMVAEAKQVSHSLQLHVNYQVMNAEELSFPDNQFDLVFTRLMTWTIPDLEKCYQSIYRVLKPGGVLVNFDGDFGDYKFTQEGHENYPAEIMEEANIIKSKLAVSRYRRPEKDEEILKAIGFTSVFTDSKAQNRILRKPLHEEGLFRIEAVK